MGHYILLLDVKKWLKIYQRYFIDDNMRIPTLESPDLRVR